MLILLWSNAMEVRTSIRRQRLHWLAQGLAAGVSPVRGTLCARGRYRLLHSAYALHVVAEVPEPETSLRLL